MGETKRYNKKRLNIWFIQTGETLPLQGDSPKLRSALLADKLIERSHDVLWWASAFDHFKKEWIFKEDTEVAIKKGLSVRVLKGTGYKKNISISRFIDHRIIAHKFKKFAYEAPRPDIIITSMPPHDLACEAVMFAKVNNIPVLVDIRDPWPDIFLEHFPQKLRKIAKGVLVRDFKMIKKTMQKADGLLAVTDTFLEWGLKYAERKRSWKDRVLYLGYKTNLNYSVTPNKISQILDKLNNKFVITFIGTFASYHNPSILVDCAARFSNDNIVFVIAGDGEFFNDIKTKINIPTVILPGWLSQEEIKMLLQHSNIGICPTPQTIDLFPNKAFAYLSEGLPIISAFQGDLRNLIEKYEIGFSYPPNDVNALCQYIRTLYEDKRLYSRMSKNASMVFDKMFDADRIYKDYAEHIERVVIETNEASV